MNQAKRPVQEFEISDALWARIEPLLPIRAVPFHPLGRHRRRIPDRKVLNSIFYLLRTGGQWKGLNSLDPERYDKSSTAHDRFLEWMEAGFFARLWEASLLDYDEMKGLDFEWMALDGAMTKAPLGGEKSGPCPCDRGKGGVKRSPLTEAGGIVVALYVDGANRNDMKLIEPTLESMPPMMGAKRDEFLYGPVDVPQDETLWQKEIEEELARVNEPEWEADWEVQRPQSGLCLDAGYDYDEVRDTAAEWGYTTHIVARGAEKQAKIAGQRARRWVVERTHSWLNRYRRLLIRWDKKAHNYLAFLHFACALITWNQSLFG